MGEYDSVSLSQFLFHILLAHGTCDKGNHTVCTDDLLDLAEVASQGVSVYLAVRIGENEKMPADIIGHG